MAKTPTPKPPEPESLSRRQQFAQTYQMAKRSDPAIGRWVLGAAALGLVVGFAVFYLVAGQRSTLGMVFTVIGALMTGVLAGLIVFSRRAQKAVYGQMEGQVGAAAGALGLLKRGWTVDNAVAFNRQQDVVHRVVGPPGIVLVGEGNPGRLKALLMALSGGSFGQLATRLRVVRTDGSGRPLTLLRALLRQVMIILVIPPLVFRPDGRGLHDLVAGSATVPLQVPQKQPPARG